MIRRRLELLDLFAREDSAEARLNLDYQYQLFGSWIRHKHVQDMVTVVDGVRHYNFI